MADSLLEVWLQPGELLWMEIQPCRARRFQVFACTSALFIFPLEAYEHWLDFFWGDRPAED